LIECKRKLRWPQVQGVKNYGEMGMGVMAGFRVTGRHIMDD
jgi:hypothetical protein